MRYGLDIAQDGALDFVALGALVYRLDPGVVPFRKAAGCAIHVSGGEFNVAANLADCFRLNGCAALLQAVRPRWRDGSEHGDGVQRSRAGCTRAGGLLQQGERGGGAGRAGRLRLGLDLRGWCALVPQWRHLRGAVGHDKRADHRRDGGGQGVGRRRLVRSQLPQEAVGCLGRPGAGGADRPPHRRERRRPRR